MSAHLSPGGCTTWVNTRTRVVIFVSQRHITYNSSAFREITTYSRRPMAGLHDIGLIAFRHNRRLRFIIAKTLGTLSLRYSALVAEQVQVTLGLRKVPTTPPNAYIIGCTKDTGPSEIIPRHDRIPQASSRRFSRRGASSPSASPVHAIRATSVSKCGARGKRKEGLHSRPLACNSSAGGQFGRLR